MNIYANQFVIQCLKGYYYINSLYIGIADIGL